MSRFMRESICEQGLYPRVACILLETINLYRDLAPARSEIMVHPLMTTDKSTDYAVVVVSVVSF